MAAEEAPVLWIKVSPGDSRGNVQKPRSDLGQREKNYKKQ